MPDLREVVAPNPRLQRILLRQGFGGQARIHLLRSPLSRKPLGSAERHLP